eukprot:TRINITY_DN1200_c0_g1_i1.p1 TRINITY_DN1200_c0_g1~~TRINITY_DN1200_c0_g1_i1.p1  ORF type:complete len:351 (-),score=72.79 TRINITY_DN1200_c0_g1_i1:35-1087(-)
MSGPLYNNILETVGNTPYVKINKLFKEFDEKKISVWVKQERLNPMHNIKDRIAIEMIDDAEKKGLITPGKTKILEATSGNTGIGLAMVGAVKGYEVTLVMPDLCSNERKMIFQTLGARCILAPTEIGATGLMKLTEEICSSDPSYFWTKQFDNPANLNAHIKTSAQEIFKAFDHLGGVDVLIGCAGTGGHISACAKFLKSKWPKLRTYAVEPEGVDVLARDAKNTYTTHKIMGMGPNFRPNTFLPEAIDEIVHVDSEDAWEHCRRSARLEGTLVGLSSGANLAAVRRLMREGKIREGAVVVTWNYDSGERYLSVPGLFTFKEEQLLGLDLLSPEASEQFHRRTNNKYAKL